MTREILYSQRRLSSAFLGERGATSVRTWSFGAGVAPASFLRQLLVYPIFIGDASFNQFLKLRFRTRQDGIRLRRQIYAVLDRRSLSGLSNRLWRFAALPDRSHISPAQHTGCLQFSSTAWRIKARDRWIGWNDARRKQCLPRLINNSRFLILPWVRIPNLASHVLDLSLRTIAEDWERYYGLRPWLAETLVDSSRFTGHCYRAANWIDVGLTTGRGRQDRQHQRHGLAPKRVLLYPLHPNSLQYLLSNSK